MGFLSPRTVTPPPAPPPPAPAKATDYEIGFAKDEARRRNALRQGYQASLLAPASDEKKTLLG